MEQREVPVQFARRFSIKPDYEKFSTCRHRSNTEETFTVKSCCQTKQRKGWVCHKLSIYGLIPHNCTNCPLYEKKENG